MERVRNTAKELQEYSAGMDSDEIREFAKDVLSLTALQPQGEQADNGELLKQLLACREWIDGAKASSIYEERHVLESLLDKAIAALQQRSSGVEKQKLRRALDNIKVRAYELGQKELHDMAWTALGDSPIKSEE